MNNLYRFTRCLLAAEVAKMLGVSHDTLHC